MRTRHSRGAATRSPSVSDLSQTRRRNALALFQAYAERALAAGAPPKGLEQAFAAQMAISPSMWSQIKGSRSIGDKLARQLEHHAGRPPGWLDEAREPATPTPAERAFAELAMAAWHATHAAGRRALRQQLQAIVDGAEPAAPARARRAAGAT